MISFFRKRLPTQAVVFTLMISLGMLTLRIIESPATSAFSLDKKSKKEKKSDDDKDLKKSDDDDDDDDDSDKVKAKKEKSEKKKAKKEKKQEDADSEDDDEDKDDEDKDVKSKKQDVRDKDDDDDDDEDKDDEDKDDEDKDDEDKDEVKTSEKIVAKAEPAPAVVSEANAAQPTEPASAVAAETVTATVETAPVPQTGDAADDPAIWIDSKNPSRSVIIGSNKQSGLAVYALDGKQLQYLPDGLMNNVDIRQGFSIKGESIAIITASNRKDNSIAIYRMNPATRQLENAAARKITTIAAYGSCMYRSAKTGKLYYFVTSKSGDAEQWELIDNGDGKIDANRVRGFKVGAQIEGCVADDELGHLYIGEEAAGIWKFSAEPEGTDKGVMIDKVGADGHLTADVEGLTIAYGKDGTGYLIASSQGNNSYVVYKREGDNEFVKTFKIGNGNGVDSVEDTDGIDVTMANLGPLFPHGAFIAQDGFNDKGNQNFKIVPLQNILKK